MRRSPIDIIGPAGIKALEDAGYVVADRSEAQSAVDVLGQGGVTPGWTEPAAQAKPGRLPGANKMRMTAELELSVAGYCAPGPNQTFSGSLEEVLRQVDKASRRHWDAVWDAYEKHGDHRNFCPQLGSGYPGGDPSEITRASVKNISLETFGKYERVSPRSNLYAFMQEVASCAIEDPAAEMLARWNDMFSPEPADEPAPGLNR